LPKALRTGQRRRLIYRSHWTVSRLVERKLNPMRVLSIKRMVLSIVLGFLLPLSYAFALSEISDFTGKTPPDLMVMPFGWPRPLWVFLMGRQPREADLLGGLLFIALCNIAAYGAIVYAFLTMLSLLRRKQVEHQLPPPPTQEPF
jgi:hypothetical protein